MAKKNKQYKNSEYWENRIANETWKTYNSAEEQNIDLLKMYEKTSNSIKKELYALAEEAEEQGTLTRTQQYRFNKLLGQQGKIFQEIEKLGEKIEKGQSSRIKDAGKKVYGNIMDALEVGDFSYPNKKEMEQMLRSPWHGSFFSENLWNKMGKLEKNLNGIINDGISTGKTVTEMAVQLSNIMNKSFNDAHRLVRTETINYMNRSAIRGYKDAGIERVQWWAAEDERTCEICGTNHEKEYDIDKAPILPCHPGCRCTWIPVIEPSIKKIDIMDIKGKKSASDNTRLINYAKESLKINHVDLVGLDYNATKNLLNTIADVYNNYPELYGSIKKITQTEKATMAVGIADDYNHFHLKVSTKMFGDPTMAKKRIDTYIDKGIFAKGTTLDTIPYHEFGHMFEGIFINRNFPDKEKEYAWDECLGATKVLKQASLQCYDNENEYKNKLSDISLYALDSDSEGLAECVHLELTGRGTKFTRTVLKILRGDKHGK